MVRILCPLLILVFYFHLTLRDPYMYVLCAHSLNRDSYDIPSGCLNNEISAWLCCVYCASDRNKRFIAILLKIVYMTRACGNGCCPILDVKCRNTSVKKHKRHDVRVFKDPVVLCTGIGEILSMRLTKLQCGTVLWDIDVFCCNKAI